MKAYTYALNWVLSLRPSQSIIAERLDSTKRALIEISRRVPYSSGSWYIVSSYRDALVWLFDEQALGTVGLAHSSPPIHQTHRKARARSTLAKIAWALVCHFLVHFFTMVKLSLFLLRPSLQLELFDAQCAAHPTGHYRPAGLSCSSFEVPWLLELADFCKVASKYREPCYAIYHLNWNEISSASSL